MKRKILIVEDTAALAENISDILTMEGFEVRVAKNGAEGLTAVVTEEPELIITDIVMPEVDGFEFIARLRSNPVFNHIPIIILSAVAEIEHVEQGKSSGANMYLTKPCDIDHLVRSVNQLL